MKHSCSDFFLLLWTAVPHITRSRLKFVAPQLKDASPVDLEQDSEQTFSG